MKKRVYSLAKELNISKEEILKLIEELRLNVKGYLGSITEEDEKKIREKIQLEKSTEKEAKKEESFPLEETSEEEILEIYVAPQTEITKKKEKKRKKEIR